MSKHIIICENYLSDVCDVVGEALDDCAKNVLDEEISGLVPITTKNYKNLLLRLLFDEEGEDDGKGVT